MTNISRTICKSIICTVADLEEGIATLSIIFMIIGRHVEPGEGGGTPFFFYVWAFIFQNNIFETEKVILQHT